MIRFGDGAHAAMIRMLQTVAGWNVEPLRDGEEPDRPDSITVQVGRVDDDGLHGWVVNDLGNRTGSGPVTFDWITYPRVHIY